MHLADRGYALLVLTGVLAIAGAWSSEPALSGAWYWAAFTLLSGLAIEGYLLSCTRLDPQVETAPRAMLGREQPAAFAFHNSGTRTVELEYAPLIPGGFEPFEDTRRVAVSGGSTSRDPL